MAIIGLLIIILGFYMISKAHKAAFFFGIIDYLDTKKSWKSVGKTILATGIIYVISILVIILGFVIIPNVPLV